MRAFLHREGRGIAGNRITRAIACGLLGLALGLGACGRAEAPARPHLVIVLADDLGWGDVGYHGSEIETPTLDRLAAAGVRLEQFYTAPTCSPSRAALLTGRYPMRMGLQEDVVRAWADYGLPEEERTLAEALRAAGYRTALVGKWHLGMARRALLPTQRGFDHHYGSYLGLVHHETHRVLGGLDWHRNEQPVDEPGHSTDLVAREAERLIADHDPARPLFLVVAFLAPHTPIVASAAEIARYAHLPDERRRGYAAMVTGLDAGVARVVGALEARGLWRDTLLLFASDNGADVRTGGRNAPLRGGKSSLYEGGIRVPAFATLPGGRRAGERVAEPIHLVDLYPTLLGVAGAAESPVRPLDGLDVGPAILEGAPLASRELLLGAGDARSALRAGDWKLVVERHERRERVELFELASDPEERRDRAAELPERVRELRARLDAFATEAAPARRTGKRPPPGFRPPAVWGPAAP